MKTRRKNSVKAISCEEAVKSIFSYIDDHLKGKQRAELEHHLEACRHCFDRVEFERLLKSRLSRLSVKTSSDKLRRRVDALLDQF